MTNTSKRRIPQFLLDRLESADADSRWYPGWAESERDTDESGHGVFVANWNRGDAERIGRILERRYDVATDWSDQVAACCDCGRAVRTEPTHYGWLPGYVLLPGSGDLLCRACALRDVDSYVDALANNPSIADTFGVDWTEHGFELHADRLESGSHGQNDDPRKVFATLQRPGRTVIFRIDRAGQLDIRFSVWIRDDDDGSSED